MEKGNLKVLSFPCIRVINTVKNNKGSFLGYNGQLVAINDILESQFFYTETVPVKIKNKSM